MRPRAQSNAHRQQRPPLRVVVPVNPKGMESKHSTKHYASLFILPPPSVSAGNPSPHHFLSFVPVPPRKHLFPLLLVCFSFILTLLPVVFAIWTLPIPSLKSIPRTLSDISHVAKELQAYAASGSKGKTHIFSVLAITSVWKNAWSIPGSALLNVLAGVLMNPLLATVLQTLLTSIGSIASTLLSKPLTPVISHFAPRFLTLTRSVFDGTPTSSPLTSPTLSPVDRSPSPDNGPFARQQQAKRTPVWVRLVILRLVGVVPWSALNLACGIANVSLWDCFVGAFIGCLPWTAVTCQVGDILQTVATSSNSREAHIQTLSSVLTSPSVILKLVILSLLSLGPVLFRDRLSDMLSRTRRTKRRLRWSKTKLVISDEEGAVGEVEVQSEDEDRVKIIMEALAAKASSNLDKPIPVFAP